MLCCFTGKIPFPFTFTLINQLSVSGLSRLICNLYFAALCAKTPAWMLSLSGVVEVNYQHWVRLPAALWRESWKGRLREDIIKQPHSISIKSLFKPQMLICMVDKNFQVFLWAKMSEHIHVTCIHAYLRVSRNNKIQTQPALCVCGRKRKWLWRVSAWMGDGRRGSLPFMQDTDWNRKRHKEKLPTFLLS